MIIGPFFLLFFGVFVVRMYTGIKISDIFVSRKRKSVIRIMDHAILLVGIGRNKISNQEQLIASRSIPPLYVRIFMRACGFFFTWYRSGSVEVLYSVEKEGEEEKREDSKGEDWYFFPQ